MSFFLFEFIIFCFNIFFCFLEVIFAYSWIGSHFCIVNYFINISVTLCVCWQLFFSICFINPFIFNFVRWRANLFILKTYHIVKKMTSFGYFSFWFLNFSSLSQFFIFFFFNLFYGVLILFWNLITINSPCCIASCSYFVHFLNWHICNKKIKSFIYLFLFFIIFSAKNIYYYEIILI